LKACGAWRSYDRHVFQFDPILVRMCERGVPINDASRKEFGAELEAKGRELEAEIEHYVPDAVRGVRPPKGYKKPPKDTAGMVKRSFTIIENGSPVIVERWCKLAPFNPNSGSQILDCIRDRRDEEIEKLVASGRTREWAVAHVKHRVPTNRKTGADTSSKLELVKLAKATGDPFYTKVIELREVEKMISTYVAGYAPGADGRIHSTFYHATGTGQLSSRNPNIQNIPKHGELARRFRSVVQAEPGHYLVEFDYKSAHALTLGFEAQDPDYMRIARIDMHSFLAAAGLLRLWTPDYLLGLDDADLAEKLAWVKKNHKRVRDKQAKPAILGYGFGMGAGTLLHNNPESFSTRAEAQKVIDTLNRLFPRTARFRNTIREKAHRQGYLLSRHGAIRRFFDVMHWDAATARMAPGDDSEAAIAFLPANDAFGHIKDAMLRLEEQGWSERAQLLNSVHDSLLFAIPEGLIDEAIP
jgi:DNA polymerase I-like protein with 3'-5' exonuclease and polymerase domains